MASSTRSKRPVCFDRTGRLIDGSIEFVATPQSGRLSIKINGVVLLAGEQINKAHIDQRRLRQLYDSRWIAVAPGCIVPVQSPRMRGPAPPAAQAPQPERRASVPRRRLSRAA